MEDKRITTIDEYIANYPELKTMLQDLRNFIKNCAPHATEKISWGMPTFSIYGFNLVHFAVNKGYIGFYPGDTGVSFLKDELAVSQTTKGSVHFLLNKEIPYDLIRKIVEYRVAENEKYAEEKLNKKKNDHKK